MDPLSSSKLTANRRPADGDAQRRWLLPSKIEWHWLFLALATFAVLTVATSLYFSHRLTTAYDDSIRINEEWADRLKRYAELVELGQGVNGPGNDVFNSYDVAHESARMREASQRFEQEFAAARADLLRANQPTLLSLLDRAGVSMRQMTREADDIFFEFGAGRVVQAGPRMASMDLRYREMNSVLAELGTRVRRIQGEIFERHAASAASLKRFEQLLAAAMLLMLSGVTVYGFAADTAMKAAAREQERHLTELEAALKNVKQLQGLIPICSYCKSVRGDSDYWHQVEEYISEHSEARFSHGICPKCLAAAEKEYGLNGPS